MHPYARGALLIGGGLFFLKMLDDARKVVRAVREKQAQGPANNQIAAIPLPEPVKPEESATRPSAVVTPESRLANSNPDTEYGEEWYS